MKILDHPELEICAGDRESVETALAGGATRVEICSALPIGGLTPPQSSLSLTDNLQGNIVRHVLLRPRPGDFLYNEQEICDMEADLDTPAFRAADGYVLGCLKPDGTVDCALSERLMLKAVQGAEDKKSFTFHRAFDMVSDPFKALEDIIALGFDRILTSGCASAAVEGIPLLRELNRRAAGRIIIMAGGGVNAANAARIMEETGVRSLHASCSAPKYSKMLFHNTKTNMGSASADEYAYTTTDYNLVKSLSDVIKNFRL